MPLITDEVLLYTYDDVHIHETMEAFAQGLVIGPFAELQNSGLLNMTPIGTLLFEINGELIILGEFDIGF